MKTDEHHIQAAIVQGCRLLPCGQWIHAIPNGGKRSLFGGAWLKNEGLLKGVPDLFLPKACCGYHGLYIEVKTDTGVVTKEQKAFIRMAREEGYKAIVVRSPTEGIDAVINYLKGEKSGI